MHEAHIVAPLLQRALALVSADGRGGAVAEISLSLDLSSLLDPESLRLHFVEASRGTPASEAAFSIAAHPGRVCCPACRTDFPRQKGVYSCPRCSGPVGPVKNPAPLSLVCVTLRLPSGATYVLRDSGQG